MIYVTNYDDFCRPVISAWCSTSGAMISVALKAPRNASPSGAVMWKLRDYIVAPLELKNMMPTTDITAPLGLTLALNLKLFTNHY